MWQQSDREIIEQKMRHCLRYLVNDKLYVEATLEDDKYQGTFKMLTVRLCSDNEQAVLGKTKFLWPEQHLPNEIEVDEEQTVILKGVSNVARIPIKMQPIKRLLYIGTSEDSIPSISVHTSLSSIHKTESFDSLAVKIYNCLAHEDLNTIWNELSKLAKKANFNSSDDLPIALPAHMQMALLKVLRKSANEKFFERVLTFLVQSRLINDSKACCKLIELLASKSLIQLTIDFLRSSLVVDDRTYTIFLKMCSKESHSECMDLLLALLEKPVNSCGLRLTASQELTEIEVTTLIKRLMLLGCDKNRDDLFNKILKLMAVLADSHSQRFIWDEKCHDVIRDAASFATTMVQLVDMFRHLKQQLEQKEKIAGDARETDSDYIIRKICFAQKTI